VLNALNNLFARTVVMMGAVGLKITTRFTMLMNLVQSKVKKL